MIEHRSNAAMMLLGQSRPASMSRGAIQHRIAACSSTAQTASATVLSRLEWLMKTSKGIASTCSSSLACGI
jgi:hypothetical protein